MSGIPFLNVLFAAAGYCDISPINLIKSFQSSGDNDLIGTVTLEAHILNYG